MKKIYLITIIIVTILAFLAGRASVKQTDKVIYKKGENIIGNIPITLPVKEIAPIEPILPYKYIFINNTKTEVVDTAKIISDYVAERSYSLTLFDNLYGKLDIAPTIQNNRLISVPYSFTPIEKTIFRQEKYSFFTSLSYNTFHIAGVGLGAFRHNVGLHYRYLWNTKMNTNGHELGVNIRF